MPPCGCGVRWPSQLQRLICFPYHLSYMYFCFCFGAQSTKNFCRLHTCPGYCPSHAPAHIWNGEFEIISRWHFVASYMVNCYSAANHPHLSVVIRKLGFLSVIRKRTEIVRSLHVNNNLTLVAEVHAHARTRKRMDSPRMQKKHASLHPFCKHFWKGEGGGACRLPIARQPV